MAVSASRRSMTGITLGASASHYAWTHTNMTCALLHPLPPVTKLSVRRQDEAGVALVDKGDTPLHRERVGTYQPQPVIVVVRLLRLPVASKEETRMITLRTP